MCTEIRLRRWHRLGHESGLASYEVGDMPLFVPVMGLCCCLVGNLKISRGLKVLPDSNTYHTYANMTYSEWMDLAKDAGVTKVLIATVLYVLKCKVFYTCDDDNGIKIRGSEHHKNEFYDCLEEVLSNDVFDHLNDKTEDAAILKLYLPFKRRHPPDVTERLLIHDGPEGD